ncbi:serine hydrolase domain-containing protein [Roseicella frigidaeris]|uniref:Serine hydrolase n=1 Tax=Roseicella frigidaeris TaxID=2230885 RepID=A0A327M1Z7_9PROT|nr:serine hydrolase domain-containing protein [Roseicella frigidaeris]RAI56192.1 serine hydrolase [Roseicella frigidaeris]
MRRRHLLGWASALTLAAAGPAVALPEGAASLDPLLAPMLAEYRLPALAAALVREGKLLGAGAVGTRCWGREAPVRLDDAFHIGSDTKAMTSLLLAMLVEQGRLRWDTTLGEGLPDLAAGMDPGLAGVTLTQLLSHTSGLPSDNEVFERLLGQSYLQPGNLDSLRHWLVQAWGRQPLAAPPGSRFAYSNLGYVMAGAIAERATGRSWEELVAERIFDPLGLATAGFGPAARLGRVDAPLGHRWRQEAAPEPMLAGPNSDNPLVIGPAGTVHLSILDFAAWAAWHAAEGRRGPPLVTPETLRLLHRPVIDLPPRPDAAPGTPATGGYALGWGRLAQPWSREPFLQHAGSNTLNLALVMLQPRHDFAMVMATNIGGERADAALKALAEALYRQHGPAPA